MSVLRTLDNLPASLDGKTILLRADLNVPFDGDDVSDTTRLDRLVPTLRELVYRNAKIVLLSHFGRPSGVRVGSMSLSPLAPILSRLLSQDVSFCCETIGDTSQSAVDSLHSGGILLLENVRFHAGETSNDIDFSRSLSSLADYFVQDSFSVVHRVHSSTYGVGHILPSFAGRALEQELSALSRSWESAERPIMAIIGGAKVSTKLALIGNLMKHVDTLIIGGAMANTFLACEGFSIGRSLWESDLQSTASDILHRASDSHCEVILPRDALVAKELKSNVSAVSLSISSIDSDDIILDIGPETIDLISHRILTSRTLIWNGPLGAFEYSPFDTGTVSVARIVGDATASGSLSSLGGGGDTLAALSHSGVSEKFSFLSTGGGAFLEWLEGRELPGLTILYD